MTNPEHSKLVTEYIIYGVRARLRSENVIVTCHYSLFSLIIESVDSISGDGPDTPILQKSLIS